MATTHEIAQTCIKETLRIRNIRKVIVVDDVLEVSIDLEEINGWLKSAREEQYEKLNQKIPELLFSELPIENVVSNLHRSWQKMEGSERNTLRSRIAKALDIHLDLNFDDDFNALNKLKTAFEGVEVVFVKPTEWNTDKLKLLLEGSDDYTVLCFFDQDLSKAEGFTAEGEKSGVGLLKNLIAQGKKNVIGGILSHTFKIGEEIGMWQTFSDAENLEPSEFLPVSKDRLRNPPDLAEGLKNVSLNQLSAQVKNELVEVLEQASQKAKKVIDDLDVFSFNQIVIKSSNKQGKSEIETLSRIYEVVKGNSARNILSSKPDNAHINVLINRVRLISELNSAKPDEGKADHSLGVSLRRMELYEDHTIINPSFSEIRTGDLFKILGIEYILLAQPCDLMVRASGERVIGGEINQLIGPLLPLENASMIKKDFEKKRAGYGFLQYVEEKSVDGKRVQFDQPLFIDVRVLDLCVFNSEGLGRLDLSQKPKLPIQLHFPWQKRFEILIPYFEKIKRDIEAILPDVAKSDSVELKTKIWDGLIPIVTIPKILSHDKIYNDGVFDFGIKRVLRYKEPEASSMLRAYMAYKSREAKAYDFAA